MQPFTSNYGGALLNYAGTMDLEETTLSGNLGYGNGGGLTVLGGSVLLKGCLVQGNDATTIVHGEEVFDAGSGIYIGGGSLTIQNSTITGNTGGHSDVIAEADGVGIFAGAGTILIENSAVTENTISTQAQGTDFPPVGQGGGIYNTAHMTIINSTIGGNSIGTMGGGIFNGGTMSLQGVTITDNTSLNTNGAEGGELESFPFDCNAFSDPAACIHGGAGLVNMGTLTIATSVIAGNNFIPANGDPQNIGTECSGVLQSNGRNALGDATGCTLKPSSALKGQPAHDLENIAPKFGSLLENGTPGLAHYTPQSGSPLIGSGGTVGQFCTAQDQIGDSRLHNICDIGAIQAPGKGK
jgi:hypothetical protein